MDELTKNISINILYEIGKEEKPDTKWCKEFIIETNDIMAIWGRNEDATYSEVVVAHILYHKGAAFGS